MYVYVYIANDVLPGLAEILRRIPHFIGQVRQVALSFIFATWP